MADHKVISSNDEKSLKSMLNIHPENLTFLLVIPFWGFKVLAACGLFTFGLISVYLYRYLLRLETYLFSLLFSFRADVMGSDYPVSQKLFHEKAGLLMTVPYTLKAYN